MATQPLPQPILCLVTDRRLCADTSLARKVALAVEGGVNMVQLREKDLPGGRLLNLALEIQQTIGDRALLTLNERLDVALLCDADGLHLGEEALSPTSARRITGDILQIGRSIHNMRGALKAQEQGVDYLIAGSVFDTRSHPGGRPMGLEFIKELAPMLQIPYLGIGGINTSNAASVIAAGASGVAVISAILASGQPRESAKALWETLKKAWDSRAVAQEREAP